MSIEQGIKLGGGRRHARENKVAKKSPSISVKSTTAVLEIFTDGCVKAYFPFSPVPQQYADAIREGASRRMEDIDLEGFRAIDGFLAHCLPFALLEAAFLFFTENKISTQNYIVCSKLYNIRNSYLFYGTNDSSWLNHITEEGFKYSCFSAPVTPPAQLREVNKKNLVAIVELCLFEGVFSSFGLAPIDYLVMDRRVGEKLTASMEGSREFDSQKYREAMYGL